MSYATEKLAIGRQFVIVAEVDVGSCSLTYGISPCTAAVGVTGDQKCFNTRATCQDPSNYTATTTTHRFCQPFDNMPIGISMIPSIDGEVTRSPVSTTAGRGLGNRAVVKVSLSDHTWGDIGTDPYVSERTYDPEITGTYWGKWLARNPYYEQRTLRLLYGYVTDPWDWANFQTEVYDITDISGPTNGKVTITGKDIFSRTYSNKAVYPTPNTGTLLADITDIATSATLTPTGIGDAEYPASGYISFGKEACSFTRSGDVLTLTRAQWGTTAKSHSAGDTAQLCVSWSSTNVVDVLKELLITGAGIPSAYIPYDDGATGTPDNWDDEKSLWLGASLVTGILMRPEAVSKIIEELSQVFLFDIWWDATAQEVMLKAMSPEPSGVTINTFTDDYNLITDSVTVKRDTSQRISTCRVFFNKVDYSEKNEPEQFASVYVSTDVDSEGSNKYGSAAIKDVYSRWFTDAAQAAVVAGRTVARFSKTPLVVSFELDVKDEDSLSMAQRCNLNTEHIQSITGENAVTKFQVTEIKETKPGDAKRYVGVESTFTGRYFFIAPDGTPDYSSASEEQKSKYGFICYNTGYFLDGTSAYKII